MTANFLIKLLGKLTEEEKKKPIYFSDGQGQGYKLHTCFIQETKQFESGSILLEESEEVVVLA